MNYRPLLHLRLCCSPSCLFSRMQHFNLGTWCISSALVHLEKMRPLSRSAYDHFITVGIFSSRKCAKLQQNRWPPAKLFCNLNSVEMLILVSTGCLCCWSRSLIEIQTSMMAILYSCDLINFCSCHQDDSQQLEPRLSPFYSCSEAWHQCFQNLHHCIQQNGRKKHKSRWL